MKFLLFSILVVTAACSSHYKTLKPIQPDRSCISRIKPKGIDTGWFDASVDVEGKHLGGLVFIKQMPDSTKRVVFTSETGLTIFDFEYHSNGTFAVKKIIPQLNRKVIIQILRKDFDMLLGLPFHDQDVFAWQLQDEIYYGVDQKKETAYFVTDKKCSSLVRLESGSKRKKKFSIIQHGNFQQAPDSIAISHHTFDMIINLKKIHKDVSQ